MLRQCALSAARLRAAGSGTARFASSAPTVFDKLVQVTVLDREGHRHVLRGLEGQSVADVLVDHTDVLGEDCIAKSLTDSGAVEAHIKIPNELFAAFPVPDEAGQRQLANVASVNTIDAHSRLASSVKLSRGLGDITVSLSDLKPWHVL